MFQNSIFHLYLKIYLSIISISSLLLTSEKTCLPCLPAGRRNDCICKLTSNVCYYKYSQTHLTSPIIIQLPNPALLAGVFNLN